MFKSLYIFLVLISSFNIITCGFFGPKVGVNCSRAKAVCQEGYNDACELYQKYCAN